jgi:pSer/pThr/pTyr-binding forkhead associated (FHA) protein/DNA-directed RNA polymerase subunit RPC12/RpoP
MKIQIGRDLVTSKLRLTLDDKSVLTEKSDVPPSVSREHCQIEMEDNIIRLRNLDINNYTYVNGQAVEAKVIQSTDKIELGSSHYLLNWEEVEKLLPPVADIRPLKEVWEEYEQRNIDLQIDERRFNTLRSITGLITMIAIALSIATGGRSPWYLVLYGVAITASLIFFVKAYRDAAKIPQQRQELTKKFQREYVCPQCGHFMGNQSYDILAQNTNCPYCKTQFIH